MSAGLSFLVGERFLEMTIQLCIQEEIQSQQFLLVFTGKVNVVNQYDITGEQGGYLVGAAYKLNLYL